MKRANILLTALLISSILVYAIGCAASINKYGSEDTETPDSTNFVILSNMPTEKPSNTLVNGNVSGLVYYSSNLFGLELDTAFPELEAKAKAILQLYLQCAHYKIISIDETELIARVEMTTPDMEAFIKESIENQIRNNMGYTEDMLLSSVENMLSSCMDTTDLVMTTAIELKLTPSGDGYDFTEDCGMKEFISEHFIIPYQNYMCEDYVRELEEILGIVHSEEMTLPETVVKIKTSKPTKDSIFIAETGLSIITHENGKQSTEAYELDIDADGEKETVCITAAEGLVILRNGEVLAEYMPDSWLTVYSSWNPVDLSEFRDLKPEQLIFIDWNVNDDCVEMIVRMRNSRVQGIHGEYYVFRLDAENKLTANCIMSYGEDEPYLGLACKDNHLAIETFVNVMGFRYMQLNATLTDDLELRFYTNGELFYKHTIDIITDTGIEPFPEQKAVLAVPLICYPFKEGGVEWNAVTLPAGTVLTPVRASCSLNLDGGGLGYAAPIRGNFDSDYVPHQRRGEIVFRDQNGDVYVVRVEITSYPSIDLGDAYFSDKSIGFEHGQWMYPESIYIGGIEQNVLFGDLDYSAYVQYFRSFLGYD